MNTEEKECIKILMKLAKKGDKIREENLCEFQAQFNKIVDEYIYNERKLKRDISYLVFIADVDGAKVIIDKLTKKEGCN